MGLHQSNVLRLAAVLSLPALLFCLFASFALAQGDVMLEIGMSAYPSELVEPGDVTLTFTIGNTSQTDTANLYLTSPDGSLHESIGCVAAGDTHTFSRTHSVTEDELNDGMITYMIGCEDPANALERISYTLQAPISHVAASPQVEFTRQISSENAATGDTVTITYRVRNTGNVSVHDLQITDAPGEFEGHIDSLDVGRDCVLVNRAVIADNTVSAPTLTYLADKDDDTPLTQTLDDIVFSDADAQLSTVFTAEYPQNASRSAVLTLELINTGATDFHDVTVTDDLYGGIIAEGIEVPCGYDPVQISHTFPIRSESMQVRWRITGTCASGTSVEMLTETLALSEPISQTASELTVSASAQTPKIDRSGNVRVLVHIENTGDRDIENAVLSEERTGEIRSFAVVPANGSIDREIVQYVSEDTQYIFSVDYTDPDGWERTAQASPVEIAITADGVSPEGAKASLIEFTGTSVKIGGSSLFGTLLIVACAVLIALVVVLIIASHRAHIEKQVRVAEEKRRRREKNGKPGHASGARTTKKLKKGKE